jgi:hypothetical protein
MASTVFQLRVDEEELERFRCKCEDEYKLDHRDVVRELITAYADGRIRITLDDITKKRSEIYAGD